MRDTCAAAVQHELMGRYTDIFIKVDYTCIEVLIWERVPT